MAHGLAEVNLPLSEDSLARATIDFFRENGLVQIDDVLHSAPATPADAPIKPMRCPFLFALALALSLLAVGANTADPDARKLRLPGPAEPARVIAWKGSSLWVLGRGER